MPKTPRLVTALLFALALTLGLAAAAPGLAAAQGEPAADTAEPAAEGWGDQEVQGVRSKGPAADESYNWLFMSFAGVVVVATGIGLLYIIRKNTRQDA